MIKDIYNIKLNNFEGPMDLLLYFINRERIDIYDIPIFQITKNYFDYINIMRLLDIDLGAEFVYMSTLLLQIKAKMLLPNVINELNDDLEDPRVELVHRLLEYKRFKNISQKLENQYSGHKQKYSKGMMMDYKSSINDVSLIIPQDIKLFDLAKTFKIIIESLPVKNELDLYMDQISIEEQILYIRAILLEKKEFYLTKIISKQSNKLYIIGFFLAILEMIRLNEIKFIQSKNFSDIKIYIT